MPKWKSILVEPERDMGGGRVKHGVTVFIPLDDAAKAHPLCDKAMNTINPETKKPYYVPKPGESPKEMQEKLEQRERDAAKKLPVSIPGA